ncbi:prepilin-type N-terminal cleavage/methylation domain-containing protein [Hathewaya histolytica]|uniref:Type IV pilin n=1 Tax=Hathewaya histolytica TaxID=1498 RepID=A0A4U9R621_HATHI|nr:prepilin-type N-terminal cleavage/methylation domain-containing protein [Hathewaya histolytica]VTQ86629.1 type IV pilin [Hathewaya histolytica]
MSFLKKLKSKKKGFTLIELIVVIAILGILAAILLPRFSGFTDSAREKAAKSEAKAVYTALETYYAEKGSYPATINAEGMKVATKIEGSEITYTKDKAPAFTITKGEITAECNAEGTITTKKAEGK